VFSQDESVRSTMGKLGFDHIYFPVPYIIMKEVAMQISALRRQWSIIWRQSSTGLVDVLVRWEVGAFPNL
jgi:hypothetical protein